MNFPKIYELYPPRDQKHIQLYSLATPNGVKVSVGLEEMEIPYDAHLINILEDDQFAEEFIEINPNSKIPTIVDPHGPDGKPIAIMESAAILLYLAEKSGRFIPTEAGAKLEALQWLFFQVGHIGPMFGQFGHFYKFGKANCDHPYPVERYRKETMRLLSVLDSRLSARTFILGSEYSIVDMAAFPWVRGLSTTYEAEAALELKSFQNVNRWLEKCLERPAVQRGLRVCTLN